MVDPGQDIEAILEITIGTSPITEVKIEIEIDLVVEMKDKGPRHNTETGIEKTGPLQSLDLVPMEAQTEIDLDALGVVNMIILQENALMLSLMMNQIQNQKT